MKYSDKLKDPRWQKKRLEIFERDEFTCQKCGDNESTLSVHHLRYIRGKNPWEYPNEKLMTLCESCHSEEYEMMDEVCGCLIEQIKDKGFLSHDVDRITSGINKLILKYPPDVTASMIEYFLSNNGFLRREWEDSYFFHCKTISEGMKNNG